MAPSSSKSTGTSASTYLFEAVRVAVALYGLYLCLYWAYKIRLQAIDEFGPVIHEFDPYFNFRATEYLWDHGAKAFFEWFDYMVWYPLGRPVGTTIYPGMQFTAVYLKRYLLPDMSLNDVCCYIPAWFGSLASFLVGYMAYEATLPQNSKRTVFGLVKDLYAGRISDDDYELPAKATNTVSPALEAGVFATGIMGVVPAHLMRSVGGGYDNESVAISAMTLTFALWMRALRGGPEGTLAGWGPLLFGILSGLGYFYMVAAWGGYVFVLNLVGCHAATLVLMGRFSPKVHKAYSAFYVVGTALAVQIPVVGWTPLKSLEQLGPCAVFLGYQVLAFAEAIRRRRNMTRLQAWKFRVQLFGALGLLFIVSVYLVAPKGYFGPISARVRGLFVKHTKTGNPLVDSVAEHQPASNQAYFQYLHYLCTAAPIGFFMVVVQAMGDAPSFLLVYGVAAYFFSNKMVRLILLTGPIASALAGIVLGRMVAWCVAQLWAEDDDSSSTEGAAARSSEETKKSKESATGGGASNDENGNATKSKRKKAKKPSHAAGTSTTSSNGSTTKTKSSSDSAFDSLVQALTKVSKSSEGILVKRIISASLLAGLYVVGKTFVDYSWTLSVQMSNPTIILKGRLRDGTEVKVDDYREAYWWIRDNTPQDSRIMAWWDYGYQITGIGNRTTIADGNTWNHEHIALLGKVLTSPVEEGYSIARHLADYVLVWAGGGGDDLAKSPHLARIANSVYRDQCPGDPICRAFGFVDRYGNPSEMMANSFLYTLHSHRLSPEVEADPNMFEEVFRSKYGKVRVFKLLGVSQESKDWVANPANKICDVEGGWFCRGQYPPALAEVLAKRKDFGQLEDFNRKATDEEYQKQYFENLNKPKTGVPAANKKTTSSSSSSGGGAGGDGGGGMPAKPPRKQIREMNSNWENTEETTLMWKIISEGAHETLMEWILRDPSIVHIRSEDGRGPLWWAFEQEEEEMAKILLKAGASLSEKDKDGKSPMDMKK